MGVGPTAVTPPRPVSQPPDATIALLGVDVSSAPLAWRERLSYDGPQAAALLVRLKGLDGLSEAVLVSTCNRTELYIVGTSAAVTKALDCIRVDRPGASPREGGCLLQRVAGLAAIRHLFSVASGVESLLLGDAFILKQLKQALTIAGTSGTLGPILSEAFRRAFALGRRVRATTDIARGETGLGAVVAAAVAQARPGMQPRVLLVGAGTTARDIARQIVKRRVGPLTIVNRTDQHASELARVCAMEWGPWSSLDDAVRNCDVVVCATAARLPIIRPETLGRHRPLLVDVGVPRNIDPPHDATCLVIDDLVARQDDSRQRREAAVPHVRAVVENAVDAWQRWLDTRSVDGLLRSVFANDRQARRDLAADLVGRGWRGSTEDAERWLGRWTARVLKGHAADLRQWAAECGVNDPWRGALRSSETRTR